MKILNFGSLNIDFVYTVPHLPVPGETLSAEGLARFPGGKGLNQSVALSRAGARALHAGVIGRDGGLLLDTLREAGVDTSLVRVGDLPSGHAIINVDRITGQNAIVICAGANGDIREADMDAALRKMEAGDWLLMQNEINGLPKLMEKAKALGLRLAFNPAPMNSAVMEYPLHLVDLLAVNETEAMGITGAKSPAEAEAALQEAYPDALRIMTKGVRGSICFADGKRYEAGAIPVRAVDTTAAGDCYIGYFLARYAEGAPIPAAMDEAARAAALCVARAGAAPSIPGRAELAR